MQLTLAALTGSDTQHLFEDERAALLDAGGAIGDAAAIDVHVLLLVLEHPVVGCQLDRWRRGTAVGRAAAGGEGDQVGPAGHLTGGRDRVVAGGVHEHQALGSHGLRVLIHIDQVAGACLGHCAQGFLEDSGQPPCLVAGRGVVVQFGVHTLAVVFPPANARHQLLPHLTAYRAAREQVLGTIDFRSFGENGGTTGGHQAVNGIAQCRVGGDPRIAI
ncbi:hypothetical protein D3C80_855940 [compost metagenome]